DAARHGVMHSHRRTRAQRSAGTLPCASSMEKSSMEKGVNAMPERRRTRRADLWSLVTDRHLLRLAGYTALCLTVGVVGYGGLQWLTDRWHPFTAFPVAIDGLVFAGLTLLLLVDAFTVRRNRQTVHAFLWAVERSPFAEAHIANSGLPEVLPLLFVSVGLLPGIVVAFSGLCRHWFLTYGGFATSATDFVSWLGY